MARSSQIGEAPMPNIATPLLRRNALLVAMMDTSLAPLPLRGTGIFGQFRELVLVDLDSLNLVFAERNGKIDPSQEASRVHPFFAIVGVAGRFLLAVKRL